MKPPVCWRTATLPSSLQSGIRKAKGVVIPATSPPSGFELPYCRGSLGFAQGFFLFGLEAIEPMQSSLTSQPTHRVRRVAGPSRLLGRLRAFELELAATCARRAPFSADLGDASKEGVALVDALDLHRQRGSADLAGKLDVEEGQDSILLDTSESAILYRLARTCNVSALQTPPARPKPRLTTPPPGARVRGRRML